jgi:hypothetical protein
MLSTVSLQFSYKVQIFEMNETMGRSAHLRSDSQAYELLVEEGIHHSQHGQPSVNCLRAGTVEGHQVTEVDVTQLRPTLPVRVTEQRSEMESDYRQITSDFLNEEYV